MPPKAKIKKEMILQTVLEITRETGFDTVNARGIAHKLQCSTQPIFTCYETMDDLKEEFLLFAYGYYEQYVENFQNSVCVEPGLLFPLSYIQFAQEEPHLFRLLFVSDMDLNMARPGDFYREIGNEKKARAFAKRLGLEPECAKGVFLDLFLYSHGIAVLTAAKKLALDQNSAAQMIANVLAALIRQAKQPAAPLADYE